MACQKAEVPMVPDPELESHLAERLAETRDVANFTRPGAAAGSDEAERVFALPEHLGGRRIADTFKRQKVAPSTDKGLEHHLKSRLAEVQDTFGPAADRSAALEAAEAYQAMRRRLGGS